MQQLQEGAKIQCKEIDKKHQRFAFMNCEHCRKYFVDSLDGITVYYFHLILHGEIQ